MRVDIKKVKGKEFVQFLDNEGHLYHLGSVADFDSWFLALFLWYEQLQEETGDRKKQFFDEMETKMSKYMQLNHEQVSAMQFVVHQFGVAASFYRWNLNLPKREPFAEIKIGQDTQRRIFWVWNDFGLRLRNRLREIYFKRRRLDRKRTKVKSEKREDKSTSLRDQNIRAYHEIVNSNVHIDSQSVLQKTEELLLLIGENEKERRFVKKDIVINEMAAKYKTQIALTERLISQLLREGIIYEPKEGYLSKT